MIVICVGSHRPSGVRSVNRKRKLSLAIAPPDLVAVKKCHISMMIVIEQAAAITRARQKATARPTNESVQTE